MNIAILPRLNLAQLPTPIEPMNRLTAEVGAGKNIEFWVKRDDMTGSVLTGNKVRKLEFLLADAQSKGADIVLTCGGVQSNHCRATAIAAVRLGMEPYLILRGGPSESYEGNQFMDLMVGARVKYLNAEQYKRWQEILQEESDKLKAEGRIPYIIPEGGSNPLGSLGYYCCLSEIMEQEKELGFQFDYVICSVGSGGTLVGLLLGKASLGYSGEVVGFNIGDSPESFQNRLWNEFKQAKKQFNLSIPYQNPSEIPVIGGYAGGGYGVPNTEELNDLKHIALIEGILLDPVYTNKAFRGMVNEAKKGRWGSNKRILFIHTGGIFGLLAVREKFKF